MRRRCSCRSSVQEPELGNFYFGRNHPMKPHRVRLTHEVLVALSVERKLAMLPTSRLTMSEMSKYHTDECAPPSPPPAARRRRGCVPRPPAPHARCPPPRRFIAFLQQVSPSNCFDEEFDEKLRRFNVGGHDCPVFDSMFQCAPA